MDWMFFTSDSEKDLTVPALIVYDVATGAVAGIQTTKDTSKITVDTITRVLETWGHADIVLHMDGEPASKSLVKAVAAARPHRTMTRHGAPYSHQSQGPVEAIIGVYRGIFVANKLAAEAALGMQIGSRHVLIPWLARHVGWIMTRYSTGQDGLTPYRRLFGKPYAGLVCRFAEYVHFKLVGRPSSRVEPRWELGVWLGRREENDECVRGTLGGVRLARSIYRMPDV